MCPGNERSPFRSRAERNNDYLKRSGMNPSNICSVEKAVIHREPEGWAAAAEGWNQFFEAADKFADINAEDS